MFILDIFKLLGKASSIADIVKLIKEIKDVIEAIEKLIENFSDDDES